MHSFRCALGAACLVVSAPGAAGVDPLALAARAAAGGPGPDPRAEGSVSEPVLVLDLAGALRRAREAAPAMIAARAAVGEAAGRLAGASVLLPENPVVTGVAGYRNTAGVETPDYGVQLSQSLSSGGLWSRAYRVDAARAELEAYEWDLRDAARRTAAEAAELFLRGLHAEAVAALEGRGAASAEASARAIQRRVDTGEAPALEGHLARSALLAAEGRHAAAQAEAATLRARLGEIVDAPPHVVLRLEGALTAALELGGGAAADLAGLIARGNDRADLRALRARLRAAEELEGAGAAGVWPDLGLQVSYANEERDIHIVLGGLSLSLPVFDRGQEAAQVGAARAGGLRAAVAAAERTVQREIRTAFAIDRWHREVLADGELELEDRLEEARRGATAAYDAGEISLAQLQATHREILEAQIAHLGRLLSAALARVRLLAACGALP